MAKIRLDLYLVEKGFALSRTQAQDLILAGQVFLYDGKSKKALTKASFAVDLEAHPQIHVETGPANRYVSRGGLKLEGALAHVGLSVQGLDALDVGISTGGFTDCLLQQGASYVLGVDVGHGQVSLMLKDHPRLKVIEGINARTLSKDPSLLDQIPANKFDLIVMDVSFISIEMILPELAVLLKPTGHLLSLVKPQFEVGVDGLAKGGIVKDASLYPIVEEKIRTSCTQNGFAVIDYFASPIEGKDGNHEFFIFAKKQ